MYIHTTQVSYISASTNMHTPSQVVENFDKMGLKDELLRGVYAYGFERPSAVQQRAVKPITSGRDVIAQSQARRHQNSAGGVEEIVLRLVVRNLDVSAADSARYKSFDV